MSRIQRIAFVSPRYPEGATVGGAETLLRALACRAAEAGCEVTFFTTCAENHFTWENVLPAGGRTVDGLTLRRFPVDEDRDAGLFLRVQAEISRGADVSDEDERVWMANSVNSRALCEALAEAAPEVDAIVTGPYLFGLVYHAAQVAPEKTVLVPCLHDEPFAYRRVMAAMFRSVRGCLFNSAPEMALARRLYELPESSGRVVGMGLDPFEAEGARLIERRGLPVPYLMYSGRREPMKGTPLLLDYLDTFRKRTGRPVGLVLTGSGPVEPPPGLAPHVVDLGFVSEPDKRDAMAGAAVFVHPSTYESFGIVLLEAWLAGTPALVHAKSDVLAGHCRESGGGLWFRHYPDFEEALKLLLDREELRKGMGDAGRRYVETHYAWPAVRERFFEALETLGTV